MMFCDLSNDEYDTLQSDCEDLIVTYLDSHGVGMNETKFMEKLENDVFDFMFENGKMCNYCTDEDEEDVYNMCMTACLCTLENMAIPMRQNGTYYTYIPDHETIKKQLIWLDQCPVQVQRSAEWYEVRHNLFSASNLWKLFGTPSQYNSLIYEKCKDVKKLEYEGDVMIPGARNWGIKYEPVSVMVYEHKFNTTVNTNYGCIPHKTLPIGASPDGINIKPDHEKYGRMLEIKNIYNREMNGISSKEYWTQMQIQMEVCQLQYCDFLETRFKEYSYEEFKNDVEHEYKGVILFFIPRETGLPSKFVYVPLFTANIEQYIETQKEKMNGLILYETLYYYLDDIQMSLVERNEYWFSLTIDKIKESWNIVLKERSQGFEHRAPQPRKRPINVVHENMDLNHSVMPNTVKVVKIDDTMPCLTDSG